jgi:HK97 family phage portal protein
MGLFDFMRRAPETKESAVGRVMVTNPGQPAWKPRDYKSFADEAFARNVVAYRSINRIADAVASVKWTLWRGDEEIVTHPLLDLLKRPNPSMSGDEYMRAKVGYMMISGNGYEERVKDTRQVRELYQLRPDRMSVIPSDNGNPSAYEYAVGGRKVRFPVDPMTMESDVRHIKLFNPINDWYGQSPIEAGAYGVDQFNESMSWIQSLLQNSARPSGALVMSGDGSLGDEQFHRLKAELEENYQGSKNAGRPMLLEGGLDWKQMGLSPSDMGILETKFSAARDVALAFGVPPQLLGIPGDNTYANYSEARLAFWEDTVIPLLSFIASDWTAWLAEPLGLEFRPDMDQVPAIVDKKHKLWEMADRSMDLTVNERRRLKGFEDIEGGDVLLVNASQIPLGMASESLLPPSDLTPADIKAWTYGSKAD